MEKNGEPTPRITAFNLKALRHLEWSPSGVCALVGPNGIGKSTALRIVEALRLCLEEGLAPGLQYFGAGALKHLDAPDRETVRITLEFGPATWSLAIGGIHDVQESVEGGAVSLRRVSETKVEAWSAQSGQSSGLESGRGESMLAAVRGGAGTRSGLFELAQMVRRSRFYARPQLEHLRDAGSVIGGDVVLENGAKNLFTVLRNWRDTSEMEHRVHFVTERMAEFFPTQFKRLDFTTIGQRTSATVVTPKWATKLPPTDWSDGFFCTLAMLSAIASVDGEGIVAIDEPENSLHPALIGQLLEAMRMWTNQKKATILLATHSPVVLDQFKEEPEKVFVMQPGKAPLPVALDHLKKREWLRNFSIGDIYSHLEVGAPTP